MNTGFRSGLSPDDHRAAYLGKRKRRWRPWRPAGRVSIWLVLIALVVVLSAPVWV